MKKTFGYILLAIGGFIALTLIGQLPKTIRDLSNVSETYSAENQNAYIAGAVTALIVMLVIAFLAMFFGLRLLKKARNEAMEKNNSTSLEK